MSNGFTREVYFREEDRLLVDEVERIATLNGTSRSEVIRQALLDFVYAKKEESEDQLYLSLYLNGKNYLAYIFKQVGEDEFPFPLETFGMQLHKSRIKKRTAKENDSDSVSKGTVPAENIETPEAIEDPLESM